MSARTRCAGAPALAFSLCMACAQVGSAPDVPAAIEMTALELTAPSMTAR